MPTVLAPSYLMRLTVPLSMCILRQGHATGPCIAGISRGNLNNLLKSQLLTEGKSGFAVLISAIRP